MEPSSRVALQSLRAISVYESRSLILIAGVCIETDQYSVLEIKRSIGSSDEKHEMVLHDRSYSSIELNKVVTSLKCVSI